jgi:hypothetical protein
MSDTPTQRNPPPTLDRILTAHQRRARIIAQLRERAIAATDELSAQHKEIGVEIANAVRRRKAFACLFVAGAAAWVGCIVVLGLLVAKGL